MIIVTGAAGFIGSNLIQGLNALGIQNILAVDDLTDGRKYRNLAVLQYQDYMDFRDFLSHLSQQKKWPEKIEAIFHQGACSNTMEWDGAYMMKNNYEYSKTLLHYCLDHRIAFLYASSAAVYGGNNHFDDRDPNQFPLNMYGYSKWRFDQYVQTYLNNSISQIVGLRYFNVYGPHENHKGKMASIAFHLMNQLRDQGVVKLFSAYDGYAAGEQKRDFIFVEDVVKVNLWFFQHPKKSGIFNCGTGLARTFNDVAKILIQLQGSGKIDYIPFPDSLKNAYQSFTQANLQALRDIGFQEAFTSLEAGLKQYLMYFCHKQ